MTRFPAVYLDHNATTPVDPRVLDAMLPFLAGVFGNPSSAHSLGREARVALEQARSAVAAALGCLSAELVFTGSGSEANSLAILGAVPIQPTHGRTRVLVSAVEHPSVMEAADALAERGYSVERLPVSSTGKVEVDLARDQIRPDVAFVSVMLANNEVGTLQPVAQIAELARANGAIFHCDAVQALGKVQLDVRRLGADLVSVSAHKIYGPKGVGALWVSARASLRPLIRGGPQEDRRRAGTENLASIAGFARACELFAWDAEEVTRQRGLRQLMVQRLTERIPGVRFYGDAEASLPNTISLSLPGLHGDELLILLDLDGICISTGSACSSGSLAPSPVLIAMGLSESEARRVVRLSLGRGTRQEDIERVAKVMESLGCDP